MLLTISGLLDPAQLEKIHRILAEMLFVDGKLTTGFAAARVKNNRELQADPKHGKLLLRILMASLGHNRTFRSGALPHRVADPIFARYEPGMAYGDHVDDPIMGLTGLRFRTDIALTVFLDRPETYDGGELAVRTSFGEQRLKLPAGDAVLYPASSRHRVLPVTRGKRRVAVTWVQSYVRDPAQRELLYELDLTREKLLREAPEEKTSGYLDRSYANLLRMWAEL